MAIENAVRRSMALLVLLALVMPGLALIRGICCSPALTSSGHCCAASVAMPVMDSSRTHSLEASWSAGLHALTGSAAPCPPERSVEIEAIAPGEPKITYESVPALDSSVASARLDGVLALAAISPHSSIEKTALRLPAFDPLSVALRI